MEKFFRLKEHGTDVKTEVIAGITTFIAMAYIIFVNPQILSDPAAITGDAALSARIFNSAFFATCIASFVGTALMGLLARLPFAQASGMGLNAFFAYTVMLTLGFTYEQALGLVFISGVLFIVITVLGLREAIVRAIPHNIKLAISGGIGLFIALIGLKNAGLVVANSSTFVGLVDFSALFSADADPAARTAVLGAVLAVAGLIVIGVLHALKVKGAILIGILASTVIGIPMGVTALPNLGEVFSGFGSTFATQWTDFVQTGLFAFGRGLVSLFTGKSFFSSLLTILVIVISFSLVDMFDTIGTLLGTAKRAGMLDKEGNMPRMREALMCDAIATTTGAMLGTSTITTFVESSAGIAEGARTGLASVVTSVLFLLAIPFAPFIGIVPGAATAPALIFVGALMIGGIRELDFDDMTEALPAFLTIAMMPLTYSIANGIAFGLISYTLLKLCTGRLKDIKIITVILAALFILRFCMMAM